MHEGYSEDQRADAVKKSDTHHGTTLYIGNSSPPHLLPFSKALLQGLRQSRIREATRTGLGGYLQGHTS